MEFDTLIRLWPMAAGIVGAISASGVLFYRVSSLEKTFTDMSHQDRSDHAVIAAKVDALTASIVSVKLEYVPKEDFNRILERIEDKLDTLNNTLVQVLSK